ncbi:T-cell activation Rho GTPase-activating protein-like [Columba livia]|uniref:T-cell activation Rho GTPase-activating protein-like n=1 Tax=Columba livia TaxID=8932 RepID=UPI0031BB91C8
MGLADTSMGHLSGQHLLHPFTLRSCSRRVAGKLPEANLLLLRTLLSLLHKISTNVPVTKMTARNLAICVGPNLLSPPEEDTLALDVLMQVTGKVTELVEFLIQHHEELFEEQEEEEEAEIPGAPAEAELASQQAEESPAPEEEGETAEVCEVHTERERMPPYAEGGIATVSKLFAARGNTIPQEEKAQLRRGGWWPATQAMPKAVNRELSDGQAVEVAEEITLMLPPFWLSWTV